MPLRDPRLLALRRSLSHRAQYFFLEASMCVFAGGFGENGLLNVVLWWWICGGFGLYRGVL